MQVRPSPLYLSGETRALRPCVTPRTLLRLPGSLPSNASAQTMKQPFGPPRGIFCNRTLNLRRIQAIGYDMDYTLIHYRMRAWEQRAYTSLKNRLAAEGWPVEPLARSNARPLRRPALSSLEPRRVVRRWLFGRF